MANRRVPKFSLNNCAQSSKKTFMCPKFCTNPVLKYTQCHISTNLSNFLKLCLLYCQKLLALATTNCRFAEKNRLSGNTVAYYNFHNAVENKKIIFSKLQNAQVVFFHQMPEICSALKTIQIMDRYA